MSRLKVTALDNNKNKTACIVMEEYKSRTYILPPTFPKKREERANLYSNSFKRKLYI